MGIEDLSSVIVVVALLIAVGGGVLGLLGGSNPNGWRASLRRRPLAEVLGRLEFTAGLRFEERALPAAAQLGEFTFEFDHERQSESLRLQVDTAGGIPRQVTLSLEGLIESDDLRTGDAKFDRRHRLRGPPPVLAALMHREVRALIQTLDGMGSVSLDGGVLTLRVTAGDPTPEELGRRARLLLQLAETLCITADQLPARLAARATDVAESRILRAAALDQLLIRAPRSPEADGALEAALQARDLDLLLVAARRVGQRVPALRKVVIQVASSGPDPQRIEALAILGQVGTVDERPQLERLAHGAAEPEPVRAAARSALAALAARHGAEGGSLALAPESADGALSVTGQAGGLSLGPRKQRKQRKPER